MNQSSISIELSSLPLHREGLVNLLRLYLGKVAPQAADKENFVAAFDQLLGCFAVAPGSGFQKSILQVTFEEVKSALKVEIGNRGVPLFGTEGEAFSAKDVKMREDLAKVRKLAPSLTFINNGADGQIATMSYSADEIKGPTNLAIQCEIDVNEVLIRPLREGEEGDLARLFFNVYGYAYINDFVYRPERIRDKVHSGELISLVADYHGDLVGHVGLLRRNANPPVYESALGVVDPKIKSKGLFGLVFKEIMKVAQNIPMRFSVYDFVTNHDYSQRLVAKYGIDEMAIFLGCQRKENQVDMEALGIGKNPTHTDRYSLLLAIKRQSELPFGKEIILPINLGELADFILSPLGVEWRPAARFVPLEVGGTYETSLNPLQKAAVFDLIHPGYTAVKRLVEEWRFLMRRGYQYAAVEMDLSYPGIGHVYDYLGQFGFFISGFIPYQMTDRLGFRFQFIAPSQVAFDEIKLYSERGRRLLDLIREDYEKKTII
jgi:hypothetical protein